MEMRRSPTITVDDLHSDVLIQILRRLDGPTLANASCATSRLHDLITTNHHQLWQALCLSSWPSLRHVIPSHIPDSHLSFFSDAYPYPTGNNRSSPRSFTVKIIISAVDIHLRGETIFSKVVETETRSRWFLSSPFGIDALDQKDPGQRPVVSSPDDLTLSWILIDPSTHRAVNLSSRRPVAIDRHWYTGEIQVKFAVVIGDSVGSAVVTCGSESGQLVSVSLTVEGGDGLCLNGEESLSVLQGILGGERKGDWKEEGPMKEVKERYWEFERKKKERKEKKVRKDGAVDLVFVLVGVLFFFGSVVVRVALW